MTAQMFRDLRFKNYTLRFVSSGEEITAKLVTYSGADATFSRTRFSNGKEIKVKLGSWGDVTLQEVSSGGAYFAI